VDIMKLCKRCESDLIKENNFIGLKIAIAVILLFLPFGIFFVWAPFLIPKSIECKKCGSTEVMELDWKEFEEYKKQHNQDQAIDNVKTHDLQN
jgi:hypothetical protein